MDTQFIVSVDRQLFPRCHGMGCRKDTRQERGWMVFARRPCVNTYTHTRTTHIHGMHSPDTMTSKHAPTHRKKRRNTHAQTRTQARKDAGPRACAVQNPLGGPRHSPECSSLPTRHDTRSTTAAPQPIELPPHGYGCWPRGAPNDRSTCAQLRVAQQAGSDDAQTKL